LAITRKLSQSAAQAGTEALVKTAGGAVAGALAESGAAAARKRPSAAGGNGGAAPPMPRPSGAAGLSLRPRAALPGGPGAMAAAGAIGLPTAAMRAFSQSAAGRASPAAQNAQVCKQVGELLRADHSGLSAAALNEKLSGGFAAAAARLGPACDAAKGTPQAFEINDTRRHFSAVSEGLKHGHLVATAKPGGGVALDINPKSAFLKNLTPKIDRLVKSGQLPDLNPAQKLAVASWTGINSDTLAPVLRQKGLPTDSALTDAKLSFISAIEEIRHHPASAHTGNVARCISVSGAELDHFKSLKPGDELPMPGYTAFSSQASGTRPGNVFIQVDGGNTPHADISKTAHHPHQREVLPPFDAQLQITGVEVTTGRALMQRNIAGQGDKYKPFVEDRSKGDVCWKKNLDQEVTLVRATLVGADGPNPAAPQSAAEAKAWRDQNQ
jgi:hypothetical protein